MIKITIDARMIQSSGIGTYIENIIKRLTLKKNDWIFYLLGNKTILNQYEFSGYKNVHLIECIAPIYSIREQFQLVRKIPKDSHVFWSPHYNIPLLYTGKLLVTVHDVFHLAMSEFVSGIHKKIYAMLMFQAVGKRVDTIVCVSNFTASELKKHIKIKPEKIKVIYNGIDESWFHIQKKAPIHDKPYLLYVGNIKPHKNLVRLLRAFQLIKDKIPHDLVLVGKKDGFITGDTAVVKLAEQLEGRVIFSGYVEDEELKQYFVQATAFVFPSLYEGFGLPPLEAMACGCPVIVSNTASLPEVCGERAIYCDPYDEKDIAEKILQLIKNKSILNKKIDVYKKDVHLFSWDICTNEIEKMIKDVVL